MKKYFYCLLVILLINPYFLPAKEYNNNSRKDVCEESLKELVNAAHTFRVIEESEKENEYYIRFTTTIFIVINRWEGKCVFNKEGKIIKSEIL